jgi:hypothetical protein
MIWFTAEIFSSSARASSGAAQPQPANGGVEVVRVGRFERLHAHNFAGPKTAANRCAKARKVSSHWQASRDENAGITVAVYELIMKNIPLFWRPACAVSVQAKIVTKTIEYKQGDTTLEGYLAYDDAITGKRPGVLVVHQWLGLTDYEKHRAEQLANARLRRLLRGHLRQRHPPERHQEAGAKPRNTKPTARCCGARERRPG